MGNTQVAPTETDLILFFRRGVTVCARKKKLDRIGQAPFCIALYILRGFSYFSWRFLCITVHHFSKIRGRTEF